MLTTTYQRFIKIYNLEILIYFLKLNLKLNFQMRYKSCPEVKEKQ